MSEPRRSSPEPPSTAKGNGQLFPSDEGLVDEAGRADSTENISGVAFDVPLWLVVPVGLLFGALTVSAFGVDWVLVSLGPLVVVLSVIAVVDLRELRIPNRLTYPLIIAIWPLLSASMLSGWPDLSLRRASLASLAMAGFYLLLHLAFPSGLGFGDVKLAVILGAQLGFFGWHTLFRGVLLTHLSSGPVAIALLVIAGRKTAFPFGPFMIFGAATALLLEGFR